MHLKTGIKLIVPYLRCIFISKNLKISDAQSVEAMESVKKTDEITAQSYGGVAYYAYHNSSILLAITDA
ncbi:hypothetical protein DVP82_12930 [Yersinia enterocolitica]|nr:hypothetical protein [Yersinia enterocolitica]EKN6225269.1 hypothetical protein [Yersinia enterocolitica]